MNAQIERVGENIMERTIRVTGKGNLSVKPDTVRLIMTVEGTQTEYDAALEESAEKTGELMKIFLASGFLWEDVKTLSFYVNAEYENYQAKDNSWKRRFAGYKYGHCMKAEFPMDHAGLGGLLYGLGHSPARPELRMEYTVAEPEACKNELLAKAVEDAKAKANVLAEASGVCLGDIVTVDYSLSETDFVSRPMEKMMMDESMVRSCEAGAAYNIAVNPDDIKVTDRVTVVWQIRA